ncbi:hypothetical protein AVEN_25821-1 [Araneus ventricosus]|uniref:Uncharacterized protein n=1 Tax=Araneus ventricosus TaxID=182803 RepID=A0A4Y2X9E5_ARAVE|nr:hypothetical protein AVEN_25821-1 [Araneus ventricosus]
MIGEDLQKFSESRVMRTIAIDPIHEIVRPHHPNTESGRLSRSSYTEATQSSRCCGVASIMLHFVQILNFLSPRKNLRVFKCPDDKRAKAVWSFLTPIKRHRTKHGQEENKQLQLVLSTLRTRRQKSEFAAVPAKH